MKSNFDADGQLISPFVRSRKRSQSKERPKTSNARRRIEDILEQREFKKRFEL